MATTSVRKPRTPSTAAKTTARKTSAAQGGAPKTPTSAQASGDDSVTDASKVTPVIVTTETPVVSDPEFKKRDLINAVVARSGVKKRDAKPAIEAALAILGNALSEGRDLNLPPLGKVKVQRQKKIAQGEVVTVRVRRKDEDRTDAPDPLAQAAE